MKTESIFSNPVRRPGGWRRAAARVVCALFALGTLVCSSVEYTYLRDGYNRDERKRLKRVVLVVEQPAKAGPAAMKLYLAVARQFISHHREYIILDAVVKPVAATPESMCSTKFNGKQPEGLLWNQFQRLDLAATEVDMRVQARLHDCQNVRLVWESIAEDDFDAEDDDVKQTVKGYVNRFGEETRPYVPGFYYIVHDLFDSLPDPELSEKEIEEKIEMDALAARRGRAPQISNDTKYRADSFAATHTMPGVRPPASDQRAFSQ